MNPISTLSAASPWGWLLPAVSAAGVLGGGALSALGGTKTFDASADWMKQFNSSNGYDPNNRDLNAGRSNSFFDMLTKGDNSFGSMMAQFGQYGNQAGDILGQAQESANQSASDKWNSFAQTQPGMMDWANQAANASMLQNGSSMEDLAKLQSQNAIRGLENMLSKNGGAMGGAQYAALARGASEPLMAAQSQLGQQRSNVFNQLFSQASNAGYSAELNRTNDLLNALSGAQNQANMYGNNGMNLAQLLNQQSQQEIMAPSLQQKDSFLKLMGDSMMQAGFKGFGNYFG